MNYTDMSPDKRRDIDRRIAKGLGELVEWHYTDLVEETVEETGEDGKAHKVKRMVPVERTRHFYVGKMTLFQTSGVISILSAVFVNGQNFKDATDRKDNLAFVEFLDEYHLGLLLSLIMDTDREYFSSDEFDVEQALEVLRVFLKYNNFFALLQKVGQMAQSMGLGAETVRQAALGEAQVAREVKEAA